MQIQLTLIGQVVIGIRSLTLGAINTSVIDTSGVRIFVVFFTCFRLFFRINPIDNKFWYWSWVSQGNLWFRESSINFSFRPTMVRWFYESIKIQSFFKKSISVHYLQRPASGVPRTGSFCSFWENSISQYHKLYNYKATESKKVMKREKLINQDWLFDITKNFQKRSFTMYATNRADQTKICKLIPSNRWKEICFLAGPKKFIVFYKQHPVSEIL